MMFRRTLLGVAGAALATALTATTAMAQEVTLRMHQFLPPQANVPKLVLDVWADNVEKDSGGRIKVERYPSMQLGGKPPELMDQAIDGVADIVWTVVGYTPGRYPSTEVFELPFIMTDARAASSAYWQMFEKHMKDDEFKDVHILGTWVHGPGMIHANKEVKTPADMEGPEDPWRFAAGQLAAGKGRRNPRRHAGACGPRRSVQRRDRRYDHPMGSHIGR